MLASGLSVTLGFGREVINAHFFGTLPELDAFLNASTIPLVLFGVFNGAFIAALVPTLSDYVATNRADEARQLGSTVLNLLAILSCALAALGWIFAPVLVSVIGHGFPQSEQVLEVHMVRFLMPGIVATSLSGACSGILNANHRFTASALVPVAANVVTITLVMAFQHQIGIYALVFGSLLGLYAQLFVQLPALFRHRLYQFQIDLDHPGLTKLWTLLLPIVIGSSASQINLAIDRFFASTLSPGTTSGMNYTTRLAFLPLQVVAVAVATTTFPLIAAQFTTRNLVGLRRSVSDNLCLVSFIILPFALGLNTLAVPIIQVLFQRGRFDASATSLCATLIPFACVALLANCYLAVISRACYACKEARLAVIGSVSSVAINIALSALLLHRLGARGLLLANAVASIANLVYLIVVFTRLVPGFDWKAVLLSILRISVASVIMALVLFNLSSWKAELFTDPVARAYYLSLLVGIGLLTYIATARLTGVRELALTLERVLGALAKMRAVGDVASRN